MGVSGLIFIPIFLAIWLVMMGGMVFLMGFGLWKMCKNAGAPHAWTSFLYPTYNICRLAERSLFVSTGRQKPLSKWSLWLLWGMLGVTALVIIFILAMVFTGIEEAVLLLLLLLFLPILAVAAAGAVLTYYALFYLYKDYLPGNEVVMLVLSILLGAYPIILLVVMNTQPVSVAGRGEHGQPRYEK